MKHKTSPPWLRGTFWQLQWAVACAALVLVAALCAWAEGLELWKRPPRRKGPRFARVADNASRVGTLALLLVACRVVSLHATSHNRAHVAVKLPPTLGIGRSPTSGSTRTTLCPSSGWRRRNARGPG